MTDTMQQLLRYANTLTDLKNTIALLQWDQETYIPEQAHQERGEQLSTLNTIYHRQQTASELGELLKRAQQVLNDQSSDKDKALVRVMVRAYDQATKLPTEFVAEYSRLLSQAHVAWVAARSQNKFELFAPHLEKVFNMNKQSADYYGYKDHPYDALLDLYEEGLTTKQVTEMFAQLREQLVPIVAQASQNWTRQLELTTPFQKDLQVLASKAALRAIGYDFNRGREDASAHPFTTALGANDRRVTNRYANDLSFIFSALHEGGHALYEQGISADLARTPLSEGVSLGIHESQSRFWENMIGRNQQLWQSREFVDIIKMFPEQLGALTSQDFYQIINQVKPSLIRVEADEVTYNLHILIRFEIEKAVIEGTLSVNDIPSTWNQKYKQYLGVDVPSDAQGCLQDIHWSGGMIGYFPTYTLGNLGSAQIWDTYKQKDPDYQETIRSGNTKKILNWLTANIYQHGAIYTPSELMQKATNQPLNPAHYLNYLQQKFL